MADTPENIIDQSIVEEMQDSYLTYSMSVIMARALPDVRDGLKPSQRRILVAMNDLNLGPRGAHRKCAKIAGDTSGNYHPHGEQVIYPTLVRMAQHWNMRYPLVQGQGNFGSLDGDPPAAMRYTEARLAAATTEMLGDIDLDTVDFIPNYDETREEPTVLPAKLPSLLINGSTGIAVGMATNLAPHNLSEVVDAMIMVIDKPEATLADLMTVIPGPDFPTGGIICGRKGIYDAFGTGRGAVVLRGKVHVEDSRAGKQRIVITELPYQVLRSTVVEKVVEHIKNGNIKDAVDVNDASDRNNPLRIEVELRKDANEDVVINQLYRFTPLQSTFHVANIALVGRQPRTLSLRNLLDEYIIHRKDVIRRRTAFLLRKARQKAHVLEGLLLAVSDIDAIIELIRRSADPKSAREALMARPLRLVEEATLHRLLPEAFAARATSSDQFLTQVQADAILSMQLQRLTGLEIEKLARDYGRLVEEIEGHEAILGDERLVLDIIREDLHEMKQKHGDARRTEIADEIGDFKIEELIPDTQVIVTISHGGYIKRVEIDTYRTQGRGGRGIKGGETRDGDYIENLFTASTHDYLLIFTNRGRVYWLRVFDLPTMSRTSRGRSIANLISFQPGEALKAVLTVKAFEESFVFFATAKGVVKKTPLGAFGNPRATGIIAIGLDPDDELIGVKETSGEDEVVMGSGDGQAIRFKESDVRAMGRSARGVRGMELRGDDRVVDMAVVSEGGSLLTICDKGYGKRTDITEYRLTKRGGKGIINIKVNDRNGKVVSLRSVRDDDELMMITANGIMIRTDLSAVREIGRATQGIRLIRVDDGDRVVAVTRVESEDDDKTEPEGSSSESGADAGSKGDAGASGGPDSAEDAGSAQS
jgi:DNA gyrase subunit A